MRSKRGEKAQRCGAWARRKATSIAFAACRSHRNCRARQRRRRGSKGDNRRKCSRARGARTQPEEHRRRHSARCPGGVQAPVPSADRARRRRDRRLAAGRGAAAAARLAQHPIVGRRHDTLQPAAHALFMRRRLSGPPAAALRRVVLAQHSRGCLPPLSRPGEGRISATSMSVTSRPAKVTTGCGSIDVVAERHQCGDRLGQVEPGKAGARGAGGRASGSRACSTTSDRLPSVGLRVLRRPAPPQSRAGLVSYVIDIGPGAGDEGGRVVTAGTPGEVSQNDESRTAPFLSRFV